MRIQRVMMIVMAMGVVTSSAVAADETIRLPTQIPYLGVATRSVAEGRGVGQGLSLGVGLEVTFVDPESPAAKQLRPRDVLVRLNDQVLVNPEQLAVLVRTNAVGQEVTLAVMRDGKEQSMTAALVGRQEAAVQPSRRRGHVPGVWRGPQGVPDSPRDVHERFLKDTDLFLRDMMEHMKDSLGKSGMDKKTRLLLMDKMGSAFSNTADRVASPMLPPAGAWQSIMQKRASASLVDGDTTLTLSGEGEEDRHLVIKDANKGVVFDGPVNTDAERHAVPEAFQAKLDRLQTLEKRFNVEVSPPPAASR